MALSRIWSAFVLIALIVAFFRLLGDGSGRTIFSQMVTGKTGDTIKIASLNRSQVPDSVLLKLETAKAVKQNDFFIADYGEGKFQAYRLQAAEGILETCKTAVNLSLGLIGIMALFMGFMSIAERAGGIRFLSRIIGPFFGKIFPEVPKGHPAMGHMMMNFSANLLGLDNAATPFGIKAMESLQEINPKKDVASNAQIMFLSLHASGLTLIPVSVIALRAASHANNPMDIFIPCMIATFMATIAAMTIVAIRQKINLFQPVILFWILGISAVIAALIAYIHSLNTESVALFSSTLSSGLILLIFLLIVAGAIYKKIDVFDAFIQGAKGGFETAVKIIPYLVGMLVAISMLRTSGSFDMVINGLKSLVSMTGMDTRFVDGLPTALVKPFSGGAARGMMVNTMDTFGADSFAGTLSCILQGSSDTTFYVIAVYFGAVNIRNTRYAVGSMLLADLVGIITSILLAYLLFGHLQ